MGAIGPPKPRTCSQCVVDRRESSKQGIRSCPGKGRQEATGSKQNCGRGSNTGRSGMEETAPATVLLTPSSFLPTLSWTASNFLFVTFPPVRHTLHDCMF